MVFVDTAVGSRDLADPLTRKGLPVELHPLGSADVEFAGRGPNRTTVMIGIECKRLSEITGDWDRFAGEQVPKMQAPTYDHRWVVIEGTWMAGRDGRLIRTGASRGPRRSYHGLSSISLVRKRLLTLELLGAFHILYTRNRQETVQAVTDLYRWWTDDEFEDHKSLVVAYHPTGLTPMSDVETALSTWPGLGTTWARVAARRFGTVRRAAIASRQEWADLTLTSKAGTTRRLGEKTAQKLITFLTGQDLSA